MVGARPAERPVGDGQVKGNNHCPGLWRQRAEEAVPTGGRGGGGIPGRAHRASEGAEVEGRTRAVPLGQKELVGSRRNRAREARAGSESLSARLDRSILT